MRHHAEHVAPGVDDAGDVVGGAVGVGLATRLAALVAVAEDDLVPLLQPGQGLGVGLVVALLVRNGHAQDPAAKALGEGQVVPLTAEVDPLTAELEAGVADQRAGQEPGLAEHLEAVTDAPHQAAALGELAHRLHHRREAGDGTGTQVVAVAEAAGEDDAVHPAQVPVPMPEVAHPGAERPLDGPTAVPVRPGAREDHHAKPHTGAASGSGGSTPAPPRPGGGPGRDPRPRRPVMAGGESRGRSRSGSPRSPGWPGVPGTWLPPATTLPRPIPP